jgi:hypothetical protein
MREGRREEFLYLPPQALPRRVQGLKSALSQSCALARRIHSKIRVTTEFAVNAAGLVDCATQR